jgi:hypothetical protein
MANNIHCVLRDRVICLLWHSKVCATCDCND